MKFSGTGAKRITYIAMASCLIAVCSWISIPFTVPFTLQTFAVFFVTLLLGAVNSLTTLGVYFLLGVIGLPVFSGFGGGIGHLLSPTGGYLIGFFFIPLVYLVFEKRIKGKTPLLFGVLTLGLVLCYTVGTVWFKAVGDINGNSYGVLSVITVCVLPYILPDLAKLFCAIAISGKLKKYVKL